MKHLATLTPEENKAWIDAFNWGLTELHYGQNRADRYAWHDICKQFPRLRSFDGCRAGVANA
jgi:hypothetical protein